ncbi:unnamed protein product, partial [Brassica napus]
CSSCGSGRWRLPQIRRRRLFSGGVEAPSAPPTPVQVPGKGVFLRFAFAGLVTECGCFHRSVLPMRNPKLLGQGRRSSRFDDEALRRGEVGQLNN